MLLMGLRLTEGIDADALRRAHRDGAGGAVDPAVLAQAVAESYLEWRGESLVALPGGRLRLDALLAALAR